MRIRIISLILWIATFLSALSCAKVEMKSAVRYSGLSVSTDEFLTSVVLMHKIAPHSRNSLAKKKIKILFLNSVNSYYVYNGQEYGLEYELLNLYAKDRGLKVELAIVRDLKSMYDSIVHGSFDLASGTFMDSKELNEIIEKTVPLYQTDLVIVQRKDKSTTSSYVTDCKALPPKSVGVIKFSACYFGQSTLAAEGLIDRNSICTIEMNHNREDLIQKVAKGELKFALVDKFEASIFAAMYPVLDYQLLVKSKVNFAAVVNPYSKGLVSDFTRWVEKRKGTSDYAWIIKKYTNLYHEISSRLHYSAPPEVIRGGVSQYDPLIKKYAKDLSWDWRLLAAQVYQESHYDPKRVSWAGAVGLMQVMPAVGKEYGVHRRGDLQRPETNIKVGVNYLQWLYKYYQRESNMSESEKLKFVLASYNAGVGHVQDARALAKKYRLNPNVWDDNVEVMMLNKSNAKYFRDPVCQHGYCRGKEPVTYVENILGYYQHYTSLLGH